MTSSPIRTVLLSLLSASLSAIGFSAEAQTPNFELEAGLGYARIFEGGGFSLGTGLNRTIGSRLASLQQAVGLSLWYAQTNIASEPANFRHRNLVGMGVRYRVEVRSCCGAVHPFLAVPLQVLRSSIEDLGHPLAALIHHGVPQPPEGPPVEDSPGGAWGWGTGLELGVEVGLGGNLNAQTRVQGLYQDIYAGADSHSAWSWHAGLRYGF